MDNYIGAESVATICFENDGGLAVEHLNSDEYYVLGPGNESSKNDIFTSVTNHQPEYNVLPNTGILCGSNSLHFLTFSIIILISLVYTTMCLLIIEKRREHNE